MEEGLYEIFGEVLYWSITPKGRQALIMSSKGKFIPSVLIRLKEGLASTKELYRSIPYLRGVVSFEALLSNLFVMEEWGWIEREVRWED